MIENIRKYTGLMMVILVILFFSFLFLDSRSARGAMGGGHAVIKIADRTYNDKEYKTLGEGAMELCSSLMQGFDMDLYHFMSATGATSGTSKEDAAEKFFVGRMILRDAKEEFGVYPADDEISAYIKSMRAFSGPDGKFNPETYRAYVEKYIGRLGLTENDVRELASDVLASKKLNSIIGSGLSVDRDVVAKNLALENQKVSGEIARMELSPFEDKIQPTEAEIKASWENIQDAFTTVPLRKFTYVLVTPVLPAETADKDAPESIAEATASDETKKEAKKKKDDEKAKKSAVLAEERRKKQLETDTLVDDFLYKLEEQKGAGFEDLAKANGWEVKTTELFAQATPPKDIDISLRASSSKGGKAVDELFKIQITTDAFSKVSEAIPVGENQWIVARMDGEEKSRPKTFEEARADARAQYISEKAGEALKTAANEAATKIKTLITGGKTFAEAAKEAGITTEIHEFKDIISTSRPDGATEPQNLFTAVKAVDPGAVADVVTESDRAFILHVSKREVVKEADAAKRLDSEVTARTNENETVAFVSWMTARTDAAKVEEIVKLH